MFKIHGFLGNKKIFDRSVNHLPRLNETIRLDEKTFCKVTEVIWCYDEDLESPEMIPIWGQRVNLRLELS